VFALHRGDPAEFPALATEITRLINEQAGLEVTQVVPVRRIPKTTSGKIQRHLLEQQLIDGEFASDLAEIAKLAPATSAGSVQSTSAIEAQLLAICNGVLAGRNIGPDDNLFEIGASSLKLIEIHEQIDREYPGVVDLTELFDHPTVAALAKHLSAKAGQG
jgi:aryl carrier-like protein